MNSAIWKCKIFKTRYTFTQYILYIYTHATKEKFKLWKSAKFYFYKNQKKKKVKTLFDSKFNADSEYVIVFYKNVDWIKKN